MDLALQISEGLARNVLAAKVNGEIWDATPDRKRCTVQLLTWNDTEGKATFWHSSAHLMAEALEALYPGINSALALLLKMAIIMMWILVAKPFLRKILKP
jgi:threonyl-tRNA synthetase